MKSIPRKHLVIAGIILVILIVFFAVLISCNKQEFEESITLNRWEYTVKYPVYDKDSNTLTFDFFRKTAEKNIEIVAPLYSYYLGDPQEGIELEISRKDVREEYGISMNHSESKDGNTYYLANRITVQNLPDNFEYVSILCLLPISQTYESHIAPEYWKDWEGDMDLDELQNKFAEEIRIYKKDCK